jgi:hypothetical protein
MSVTLNIGCYFVDNSKRIIPNAHISTFDVDGNMLIVSGAIYAGVPI